jgi:hypothetical protein
MASTRSNVGRVFIALAVLLPLLGFLLVFTLKPFLLVGVNVQRLTPWILGDLAVLGIGYLLNRGEDV